MLPRPVALLLDFGGVLADAPARRTAPPELVLRLYNLIGSALTPGEIQRSLTEGRWPTAGGATRTIPTSCRRPRSGSGS